MTGASHVLAHLVGLPIEEAVLFGLPTATLTARLWWVRRKALRFRAPST